MDLTTIALGVSFILAILASVFGIKWKGAKDIAKNIVEIAEKIIDAIEDDKVTEDEVKDIAKKGKSLIEGEKVKIEKKK